METAQRAGRIIGVLIILQMIGGWLANFRLEAPVFAAPGFLVNAAPHSQQLGLAVLVSLVTEALMLGIAITALPIIGPRARAMALWLVALAGVCVAVAALENTGLMSMVTLSEAYAKASDVERGQLQTVRVVVASARNWAHYLGRIFDGVATCVFYAALFRLKLVPRALAGFGLIAVPLMIAGVAMPFFGHGVVFPMLAPLGLSQLLLAAWLIAKGFRDLR